MEGVKKVMILGMLLGLVMIGSEPKLGEAQSFCHMPQDGLRACLPSCESGENTVDPPSSACCSAIAKADLKCLCQYKDSGLLTFYGVDPNKAMQLPVKCKMMNSFHC